MKRKMLICLIAVLALGVMGFGFAKWSDSVSINTTAQSGELKWGFVPCSSMQKDVGPDWHTEMSGGMENVFLDAEGKDVGETELTFVDSDGDGVLDTLNVDVRNAYPCYYNEISAKVKNYGTIPTIIQNPVLHWGDSSLAFEEGVVYYLLKDGTILLAEGPAPDNAVIEICYLDNVGSQQHPNGGRLEESWDFHVLQPAEQNATYNFSFTVEAVQWNESEIGPWQK